MKKIFTALVLLTIKIAAAQTAATNTGILYITGSADIFCAGSDLTNNSGSALTNNGQLYIKGNLTNNQSSVAIGTGTLYLNGISAQTLNGSQPFRTYHLNTNNSSGITLNNNLSVSGIHTFAGGVITTSATPNYLVYEAGSSYTGDADTRHVNGWVKKFGSTNFVFPVGNGTYERTIALSSLSGSSEFDAKYLATTPNPNSLVSPVHDVDDPEYWSINKVSGGTATVTLNWNYPKVYFPNWIIPDILVAGYNGTAWTNNGGAGTASGMITTTGTVTSASISSFNLFTFGSQSYILPLRLIDFTAVRPGTYTQIAWTTDKEFNAGRFVVERSDDGISFYAITQLAARNIGFSETYQAKDNKSIDHIAYYRLRIITSDGHENFSKTVTVTVIADNNLTLLINPVHDKIELSASASVNGSFQYTITTINGKLAQQGRLQIQNGGQYRLPLKADLSQGIYIFEVRNDQHSYRFKIRVQ